MNTTGAYKILFFKKMFGYDTSQFDMLDKPDDIKLVKVAVLKSVLLILIII